MSTSKLAKASGPGPRGCHARGSVDGTRVDFRFNNRQSNAELKAVITECVKTSTDCSKGPHGPIGSWDVSGVTDMSYLFIDANNDPLIGADKFNGDISKWDVSRV